MTSYDINHKAIADLRDIYEYGFIHYGEERADKYHADIFLKFDNIAATPLSIHPLSTLEQDTGAVSVA